MSNITIAGRTLAEWADLARRDNCFNMMVPSDLRMIIASHRDAEAREAIAADKAVEYLTRAEAAEDGNLWRFWSDQARDMASKMTAATAKETGNE